MHVAMLTDTSPRIASPVQKTWRSRRSANAFSPRDALRKPSIGSTVRDVPEHKRGDIGPLKVDILDRLGRTEDAQAVRWAMFATSLSAGILDEYLSRLPEDAVYPERIQREIGSVALKEIIDIRSPAQKDATQDQGLHGFRMGYGVSQSERASPAAAKDVHLAVDIELTAQPQHVIDQMRGRVVGECRRSVVVACARCALATAALVEKNDPVAPVSEITRALAPSEVRTRLPAGGSRIRTFGPRGVYRRDVVAWMDQSSEPTASPSSYLLRLSFPPGETRRARRAPIRITVTTMRRKRP
jgi:hypothetical protein